MQPADVPHAAAPSSNAAITALVLSVVGLVCCGGVLSPFGWYLGQREIAAVDAGTSAVSNRPLAQIAVIVGIVGTVMLGLLLLWVLLFGGLALMAGLIGAATDR